MSWKINNQYNYPKSIRSIYNGARHYDVGGEKLPSVTHILSLTKSQQDKDALNSWKRKVGFASAAKISKETSELGTKFHKFIEEILLGRMNEQLIQETNLPKQMAETIIENGIKNRVSEVYGCEVVLYNDGPMGYAGTADAVIKSTDNKVKILDMKSSSKPKRREWSVINEYFLQCALYAICHDKVYGTNINSSEILMCTPNLIFQKFEIKDQEFDNIKKEAMKRVEQYYNLKNQESNYK